MSSLCLLFPVAALTRRRIGHCHSRFNIQPPFCVAPIRSLPLSGPPPLSLNGGIYQGGENGNESSVVRHAIDSFVAQLPLKTFQPNGVETRGHEDSSHDNPSTDISENLVNSPSTDTMNP
jgi:hypothetical protein